MRTADPFGRTDLLDSGILEALVTRFEARGQHPLFSKMLHDYLDAMRIDGASHVLDLGCGASLAARAIVHRPGFSGRVTGVDLSPSRHVLLLCPVGSREGQLLVIGD